jgi:hypothetical protein
MGLFLNFGEKTEDYEFKVINERAARASAGIMFLFGILSLFSVYIYRTIFGAELFSITFIMEFFVRTVINPKYAPYMLLGGLIVSNQQPDWVEAKPKQFAWILGLILGVIMTYYIVFDIISLVRLSICWLCLSLLYLESAFDICLGCILYKSLNKKLYKCPGGVCETPVKQGYDKKNVLLILVFVFVFFLTYVTLKKFKYDDVQNIVIVKDLP